MTEQLVRCDRCGGKMVDVYVEVGSPDDSGSDIVGRHCVNCGEYVDELVMQNRRTQRGGVHFPFRSAKERSPTHRVPPMSIRRRPAVA